VGEGVEEGAEVEMEVSLALVVHPIMVAEAGEGIIMMAEAREGEGEGA
ncbi:hypothetical protein Tco_0473359, partial [Tanacetum coccineum]